MHFDWIEMRNLFFQERKRVARHFLEADDCGAYAVDDPTDRLHADLHANGIEEDVERQHAQLHPCHHRFFCFGKWFSSIRSELFQMGDPK